ncbi:hypothetical protein ACYJ1Y_09455 [Natrialbaceae archaeon A-gly3]
MSSRNPDELKAELEEIDFSGEPEQLSELRAEARETVTTQKETLNDIDTKASKILRLNIAVIGILVSGLSIGTQIGSGTESDLTNVEPFVNVYTTLGIGALVLSTAFAAMTYTASELDIGVSSENLADLLRADFDNRETEELLLKNYIMRINFNRSTNVRNIPLIQLTIILVVLAIISFVLGIYRGIIGPVPWWLLVGAALLIVGVVAVSGLIKQSRRAVRDVREWH